MLKVLICLTIIIECSISLTFAQKNEGKAIRNLQLYILAGQSNMAGRGELTPEQSSISHPRVYMLDKDLNWKLAKNPLHFDKPGVTGVGPGLSFGIAMAKGDSSINIGLIPCAVGGTSIEKWAPGAFDPVTKTHPYDDAVTRIREAMKSGTLKGMIWIQGESNASAEGSKDYLKNLKSLVNGVRTVSKNRELPVVIGELGRFREGFLKFNVEILDRVESEIPYTALVSSERLNHKGDSTHFNAASAKELGLRFARKMQQLQQLETNTNDVISLAGKKKYRLVFSDEFNDNKLDTLIWQYRTDNKHWSIQVPENVTLADGLLNIALKKEKRIDKEYSGGGIISKNTFGFGYYEARFKIPRGSGWHNSFWLMKHDGTGGTGPSASALEIDICENDSRNRWGYNVNLHRWMGEHIQRGTKFIKTPDISEDFHVWGCENLKNEVRFYFDGKLVQTIEKSTIPDSRVNIWFTSIASFLGNTNKVDDSLLPDAFQVDYVRYYK